MEANDNTNKKADIVAVAKAARVSISTVSRAFNHPDLVKPATRKKIDRAVKRLGYIRNRAAQTIHGIRSGTIGLVVPTIDHAIFSELVQSFQEAIDDKGFTLLLASHGYDLEREYALARKMLEHRVDGLALIGLNHAEETFQLVEQQAMPTVLLWNYAADSALPCIGADNFRAGQLIGDHVMGLGHRDVALLFPPLAGNDRAAQRLDGVRAALDAHGVTVPDRWMLQTPYSVAEAKQSTAALFAAAPLPGVVICGNDVLAHGAILAAHRAGLSVPGDVSITGIGDFNGSKEMEPALTTVRIPARQIGETAANEIAAAIVEPGNPLQSREILPELCARRSAS